MIAIGMIAIGVIAIGMIAIKRLGSDAGACVYLKWVGTEWMPMNDTRDGRGGSG